MRGRDLPVAVIVDHVHQLLQDQQCVPEQAVTDRRRTGQSRIGGDLQQFGALGQIIAGHVRVVPEDLRPDHHHDVVTSQHLADTGDGHRQLALEKSMILGEGRPVGQRAAVHRRADLLRKRHSGIPGAAAIDFRAEDQSGRWAPLIRSANPRSRSTSGLTR